MWRSSEFRFSAVLSLLLLFLGAGCGSSNDVGVNGSNGTNGAGGNGGAFAAAVGTDGLSGIGGPTEVGPGTGVPTGFGPGESGGGGSVAGSPPTSIDLPPDQQVVLLDVGDTVPLRFSITLADGAVVSVNQSVSPQATAIVNGVQLTYKSLDTKIVTVNAQAILTGIATGNTQVEVSAKSGGQTTTILVPVSVGLPFSYLYIPNPTPNGGGGWLAVLGVFKNGKLSAIGEKVPNGGRPLTIGKSPDGKFIYAINVSANNITPYTVDLRTGLLTRNGDDIPCGNAPRGLVFTHQGRFAYAGDFYGSLTGYNVLTDGRLEQLPGPSTISGMSFVPPVVNPAADHIYSINSARDTISAYSADPATGVLTFIQDVATGDRPFGLAFHATLPYAYASNSTNGDISAYRVSNALLASLGPTIPGPTGGVDQIATHPTLPCAYTASASGVSVYAIDPGTGALTFIETEAVGPGPGRIIIDPSGQYMFIPVASTRYYIEMYVIEPDGTLTPNGIFDDASIAGGFARDGVSVDNPFLSKRVKR